MTMTRKGRRVLKNATTAMICGSVIGTGVGIYLHLSTWFFMVMGLLMMFGVSLYPDSWSSHHKHHHRHQEDLSDTIYDEA